MKKIFDKKTIFSFILGILLCNGIVYGVNTYESNTIEYSPTDASWNVSNVNDAINSLHSMVKELETIKSIGDAAAAQILAGKKALVKGSTITGTMANRGAWTNTPTTSGKVTIPAGYHNGSGYVDTSAVHNAGYNYILTSQIISTGTDTTSVFFIIEYKYSDIEGYTKVKKIKTDKSTGRTKYSGDFLDLIGVTSSGVEETIAAADSSGEFDISGYTTIKQRYIYRPGDTYIINLPILLP